MFVDCRHVRREWVRHLSTLQSMMMTMKWWTMRMMETRYETMMRLSWSQWMKIRHLNTLPC